MDSRLQIPRIDRVIVEAVPLGELRLSKLVRLVRVPLEHVEGEGVSDAVAVVAHDGFRVVEQVVGVNNAYLYAPGWGRRVVFALTADLWANETRVFAVVEETTQLDVPSLAGHEAVKLGSVDKRRDATPVIAWNGIARVANEEGEVESLQDLPGDNGGIASLGRRTQIWVWTALGRAFGLNDDTRVADGSGLHINTTVRSASLAVGTNSAFKHFQRGGYTRRLLLRRYDVVDDVLDEDSLALVIISR